MTHHYQSGGKEGDKSVIFSLCRKEDNPTISHSCLKGHPLQDLTIADTKQVQMQLSELAEVKWQLSKRCGDNVLGLQNTN